MMTQNDIRAAGLFAVNALRLTAAAMLEHAANLEAGLPPEETADVPEAPGDGSTDAGADTSTITVAVVTGDGVRVELETATDTVVEGGQTESLADLEKSGDAPGLVVNNGADTAVDQVGDEVKVDTPAVAVGNDESLAEAPAALENQAAAVETQGEAVDTKAPTGGTKGGAPDDSGPAI